GYGGYIFALLDDGRLTLGQVGISGVNSVNSIHDTNWHHVAVSKVAGTVTFYVDGVGEAAPQYDPGFYFISSVQIGASQWDGTRPTGSFLGLIDEVSIYNRALAGSEVQSIYQASSAGKCPPVPEPHCVQPPSGLVGWWKGDGATTDTVGSNNGALVGNASFAPGIVGQAFSFDGDNDSVMIGNPSALQLQNFTIEAWIKRANPNQASLDVLTVGHIFGYGYGGYIFALLDDGRLTLGQVGISGVNSVNSIHDTNWHHVAVSKVAGTVTFYVDGVGEAAPQYDPGFYFISSVQIGASQWDGTRPTGSFLGLIDEVSIYNRALAGSEVQSIYQASSAGKCPPVPEPHCVQPPSGLVGWWKGDGATTDTVGSNNGALVGNASFAPGIVGQAFSFDGDNDSVMIGNPSALQLQNFTIEAWIKRA